MFNNKKGIGYIDRIWLEGGIFQQAIVNNIKYTLKRLNPTVRLNTDILGYQGSEVLLWIWIAYNTFTAANVQEYWRLFISQGQFN